MSEISESEPPVRCLPPVPEDKEMPSSYERRLFLYLMSIGWLADNYMARRITDQ